jgi:hypothetical protein
MRAKFGYVVGITTDDVIGQDCAFKYHLCIGENPPIHLYVCEEGYPDDFEVTAYDCEGLDYDSFVSVSRVIRKGTFPNNSKLACRLGNAFMGNLRIHIAARFSIKGSDRTVMLNGLDTHII